MNFIKGLLRESSYSENFRATRRTNSHRLSKDPLSILSKFVDNRKIHKKQLKNKQNLSFGPWTSQKRNIDKITEKLNFS